MLATSRLWLGKSSELGRAVIATVSCLAVCYWTTNCHSTNKCTYFVIPGGVCEIDITFQNRVKDYSFFMRIFALYLYARPVWCVELQRAANVRTVIQNRLPKLVLVARVWYLCYCQTSLFMDYLGLHWPCEKMTQYWFLGFFKYRKACGLILQWETDRRQIAARSFR